MCENRYGHNLYRYYAFSDSFHSIPPQTSPPLVCLHMLLACPSNLDASHWCAKRDFPSCPPKHFHASNFYITIPGVGTKFAAEVSKADQIVDFSQVFRGAGLGGARQPLYRPDKQKQAKKKSVHFCSEQLLEPVGHEVLRGHWRIPSVMLRWAGLCPIMLYCLWGPHQHRRWCWGAAEPENKNQHAIVFLSKRNLTDLLTSHSGARLLIFAKQVNQYQNQISDYTHNTDISELIGGSHGVIIEQAGGCDPARICFVCENNQLVLVASVSNPE